MYCSAMLSMQSSIDAAGVVGACWCSKLVLHLFWVVFQRRACHTVQDNFARIMAAYEDRTLSVWLEVAEQFGMSREAAAQLSS